MPWAVSGRRYPRRAPAPMPMFVVNIRFCSWISSKTREPHDVQPGGSSMNDARMSSIDQPSASSPMRWSARWVSPQAEQVAIGSVN